VSVPPARRAFLVNVADLRRRPGSGRDVTLTGPIESLAVVDAWVTHGTAADVAVHLESLPDALTVSGTVAAPWEGRCRRCLGPVAGRLVCDVQEVCAPDPAGDDIWPLSGDQLDLYPIVVEALTLELPLAPLCRDDCAGLCPECGADRNETDCGHAGERTDPRWAALESMEFPGGDAGR
jgi:uncharacterized protein